MPQPGDTSEEEAPLPTIREFDVATLSRLGREIYRQDQYAWHGTDAVMEQVGQEKMSAEKCCGWVVDTSGAEPLLRFVRKAGEGEEAAYDVAGHAPHAIGSDPPLGHGSTLEHWTHGESLR